MKKFGLIFFTLFTDLFTISAITSLFWITAASSSGFLLAKYSFTSEVSLMANLKLIFIPFLIIAGIYTILSVIFKRSLGTLLCNEIRRRNFWKILATCMLDFSIIVSFTIIIDLLLQNYIFFETFNVMFLLIFVYCLISAVFKGFTIGRYFFGIKLRDENDSKSFFKYEMIKFAVIIAIPYLLMRFLGIKDTNAIFLDIVFLGVISTLISIIVIKKSVWAKISGVTKQHLFYPKIRHLINFVALILFFISSFFIIRILNNHHQPEITKWMGFNYPFKYPDYPHEKPVKPYVDFLKTQHTSPKDYILGLFEKYDVVILQESYHGESTQWDLITEIVHDSIFIHNVGHVFTEYGSAIHQDKIDKFLKTEFENDSVLKLHTAKIMYYMSAPYYYFIKNVNILNSSLPDSLKLRVHFTDNIDWDYFGNYYSYHEKSENFNRDSLMAQVTIDWYKSQLIETKRHKCLVVTNYRHANGYAGGVEKVKNSKPLRYLTKGNQGQYIWEAIPEKTANVLQHRTLHKLPVLIPLSTIPIHNGKWDKAFAINGNIPVGFDLANTVFGNDDFDIYPLRGAKTELTFSDIYTGFVFNKPTMELRSIRHYPYQKLSIEQEILEKGITDSLLIERILYYTGNESYYYTDISWFMWLGLNQFIPILFFIFFGIINIFIGFVFLIWKLLKKALKQGKQAHRYKVKFATDNGYGKS